MQKAAKLIRVLTVAPLMTLVLLTALLIGDPRLCAGLPGYLFSVLFLVVLPLLAYPLQPLIPGFRGRGREGQRTLAMYFAVAGYLAGCAAALALRAPAALWIIYLCYLLSGVLVTLSSRLLHFKASGHACGVAGPFALLALFRLPLSWAGLPLLALVWFSSRYMKRHTPAQLLAGAVIPVAALGLILLGMAASGVFAV